MLQHVLGLMSGFKVRKHFCQSCYEGWYGKVMRCVRQDMQPNCGTVVSQSFDPLRFHRHIHKCRQAVGSFLVRYAQFKAIRSRL